MDVHADRTALRLKLYERGYTPLPNKRKMTLIKGWSKLEVTPELIASKEWARSKAFLDTGIRGGDVVALDFDIDNPDLLNELLDKAVESGLVEESPFVRIGRPPRELWVFRTTDRIGKRTTGHFVPPGSAPDFSGFAVEVLGAGCQFAAYGQRDDKNAYAWPVESLVDHDFMDLPVITLKQAEAVCALAVQIFEARGLERKSPAGGTDGGYTRAYDLEPDMAFDVQDMGVLTVAEMAEVLQANPDAVLRCKVDAFRPTSGSWAGMASLVGSAVCISDHGTYTSHFPVEMDTARALAALGALLAERYPDTVVEVADDAAGLPRLRTDLILDARLPMDDNVKAALNRYVYVVADGLVCDMLGGFAVQKMRNFHDTMAPFYESKPGPRGGDSIARVSELWREHPDRITVAAMQMRPDKSWPFFTEKSQLYVNTYEPTVHVGMGDARIGLDMLRNLLPVPAEHAFFMQWLGYKLAHPWVPGPAIVMVAHDSYGTGRGSLITLLTDIFGDRYVNPVDFATLTGQGSQSQYNEWQTDSLLVTVNEAQETAANMSSWQVRNNAYERLKNVLDPSGRGVHVKRKSVRNSKERTFASILIATNHVDAFVIPPNDRRIAVLENGPPPTAEYWATFHAWRENPANIAALVAELRKVDLTGYNPYAAPMMTEAKREMVDAGASDIDRALHEVLAGFVDTLLVREQVILKLEDYLADNSCDFPDDWQRLADRLVQRRTRKTPIGVQDRVRIEGRQRVVRMIGKPPAASMLSAGSMVDTILSNGPISRKLNASGKVVAFPSR